MCCTSAFVAEVPAIREKAALAEKTVVIDGCSKACAKKIVEQRGHTVHAHVELGKLGMEKNNTPVSEENIDKVVEAASEALDDETA